MTRFLRYTLIQVLAYGMDLGGFLLLVKVFGVRAVAANVCVKIIAGAFTFFAHQYFTFKLARDDKQPRQVLMYLGLYVINVPLSAATLALVLLAMPFPVSAKLISDGICAVINYWLSKSYIFVARRRAPSAEHARDEA